MENGMTPADVAAVTNHDGYGDGFGFGGGGLWLFAILALMWGGFGGNRWGNDGRCATVEDLNNSANFTRLESQVQGNGQMMQQGFTNLGNGICQLGYQLATDVGTLEKQISECCCTTQRAVDSVKFDMANYAAATNANVTAQVQSIKDMLCAEKAAAQAARIQQLELQQALCGVVRYPTQATYATGFPFWNNGCCGCNGNI